MMMHWQLHIGWSAGRLVLLVLVLVVGLPALASAAELYQWKDAAGVVHFTDNPDAVPLLYRNQSQRQVTPLAGVGSPAGDNASDIADADVGQKVWETKCQACHVYNSDVRTSEGQTRGLFSFIVNPETKFPYSEDTIVNSLRKAANGGFEDMPAVDISDSQLKSLAQFLINAVAKP